MNSSVTNTKVEITCHDGWKRFYEPIVKKIIEHDEKEQDSAKRIGLKKVCSSEGLLTFECENIKNFTEEITNDVKKACRDSMFTCEYCGTTDNVGMTDDYITICPGCWSKYIVKANSKSKWKALTDFREDTKKLPAPKADATTEEEPTFKEIPVKQIAPPIMILFGEWLGFVSPLIDLANDICDAKIKQKQILNALAVEARLTYEKMREEYSDEELHKWFYYFYDVYLKDREDAFNKAWKVKKTDDLPF